MVLFILKGCEKLMIRCRLRILLAQNRLNQQQFSELSGLSLRTIRNYYKNTFKIINKKDLLILCETLKCSPGDLFVYENFYKK
ncbi:helix-turn-helix domain-containing protein [Clostridium perfringens]|nr:XRE family transcriptional regulator [Clostridium perfringens]PWW90370.1 XRE family transcriptional regulator [Clostridium perfringens]PWX45382.1 XRE family transcriptional regulator [Clostridium perfringens]PWX64965.1 XRE family transcriptional regulator [Clostridium perfringens]QTZ83015.1 Cro/CI repressor [Clostridium phage vB_CpeS-1181]